MENYIQALLIKGSGTGHHPCGWLEFYLGALLKTQTCKSKTIISI